jgi:hypothetical protein
MKVTFTWQKVRDDVEQGLREKIYEPYLAFGMRFCFRGVQSHDRDRQLEPSFNSCLDRPFSKQCGGPSPSYGMRTGLKDGEIKGLDGYRRSKGISRTNRITDVATLHERRAEQQPLFLDLGRALIQVGDKVGTHIL